MCRQFRIQHDGITTSDSCLFCSFNFEFDHGYAAEFVANFEELNDWFNRYLVQGRMQHVRLTQAYRF